MQNQNICSKCQGSVHFFEIAASKKGKNPCKTKIFFQSVRVLGLFLNLPLFTFARTLHENQDKFVTWPSKVVRPPDQCQRVGGKISLIMSDLEATVLNQIPQKFNFRKFYILRPLLRLQHQQNHRTCLFTKSMGSEGDHR